MVVAAVVVAVAANASVHAMGASDGDGDCDDGTNDDANYGDVVSGIICAVAGCDDGDCSYSCGGAGREEDGQGRGWE